MGVFRKVFGNRGGKHLEKKKSKKILKAQKKAEKQLTFTKIAIGFVLINSELQIWASYVLAFLGRDAIAEALSQQIVITIIGTMVGYFVKSLVENLSKYTTLFGQNLEFTNNNTDCVNENGVAIENCNDEFNQNSDVNFCTSPMCDGITPINTNEDIIM